MTAICYNCAYCSEHYPSFRDTCDLTDEEKQSLTPTEIALDGIAVIVNPSNGMENLTSDQVKGIFTGEITDWADVQ